MESRRKLSAQQTTADEAWCTLLPELDRRGPTRLPRQHWSCARRSTPRSKPGALRANPAHALQRASSHRCDARLPRASPRFERLRGACGSFPETCQATSPISLGAHTPQLYESERCPTKGAPNHSKQSIAPYGPDGSSQSSARRTMATSPTTSLAEQIYHRHGANQGARLVWACS